MKNKVFSKKLNFKNDEYDAKINIIIEEENDKKVLSICGTLYDKRGSMVASGQCIDTIAECIPNETTQLIKEIWERWHLNDMHAGCIHQREFEKEPYDKHRGHVCEICNYQYGTGWIYEELPEDVIKTLKSL